MNRIVTVWLMIASVLTMNGVAFAAPLLPVAPQETATKNTDSKENGHRRLRISIGPEVAVYMPINAKTRERFGDTWLSIGITAGKLRSEADTSLVDPWINILYQKHNDSHACLIPLGVDYTRNFAQKGDFVPYAGAGVAMYLCDLRSDIDDVHSGLRTAVGMALKGGVYYRKTSYLQIRYNLISRVKRFDLSGAELTVGVRF